MKANGVPNKLKFLGTIGGGLMIVRRPLILITDPSFVATTLMLVAAFIINATIFTTESLAAPTTVTFPANAGTTGAIPDGVGTCWTPGIGPPRDVTFTVSGMTAAPAGVSVTVTMAHTWVGDIIATLIAPDNTSFVLFGRTGSTTAAGSGDDTDATGTYTFSDSSVAPPSGGWWQEATARTAIQAMTSGAYRTTGSGGAG